MAQNIINKLDKKILLNIIIFISFTSFFYFWDAKIQIFKFDFRILILIALPFFFKEFFKFYKIPLIIVVFLSTSTLFGLIFNQEIIFNFKTFIKILAVYYIMIFSLNYKDKIFEILPSIVKFFILFFTILTFTEFFNILPKESNDPSSTCAYFADISSLSNINIFKENSHFGLIAAGTFIYYTFQVDKKNFKSAIFLYFPCILFLSFIYSSATLKAGIVISCFLFIILNFKKKYFINLILLSLLLIVNIVPFLYLEECVSRVKRLNITNVIERNVQINEIFNLIPKEVRFKKTNLEIYNELINANRIGDYDKINQLKKMYENTSTEKQLLKINEINKIIISSEGKYQYPNLTVDVYRNALLITLLSIFNEPLGVGFDHYKYSFIKYTPIIFLHSDVSPEILMLNVEDGRANIFKISTEFGIFSIILYLFLIYFLFSKKFSVKHKAFLLPTIITQMISAAGYFNGGFIICLCLILSLILNKKKTKNL